MSIQQLVVEITKFFREVLEREAHVISLQRKEDGWLAQVETVEDAEYMRNRALDDVMGLYEVEITNKLEISSYKRIALRQRPDIEQEDKDEE